MIRHQLKCELGNVIPLKPLAKDPLEHLEVGILAKDRETRVPAI